jgi:HK97 family phage prohead protease
MSTQAVHPAVRFAGYAAIFDRPDRGGDVVRPGAFRKSLARGAPVPLLWHHDRARVVGAIERLEEDQRGLRIIARVFDPAMAEQVESGAVRGLSFGYRVQTAQHGHWRELTALELVEISLVAIPMQPAARVHAVAESLKRNRGIPAAPIPTRQSGNGRAGSAAASPACDTQTVSPAPISPRR